MDFNTLVSNLQNANASITNGWDAVCSINAEKLTAFCLSQYAQNQPDTAANRLQIVVMESSPIFWCVDLILGPPLISFPENGSNIQCQVDISVLSGTLTKFNADTNT